MAEPPHPSSLMALMFTDIVNSKGTKNEIGLEKYQLLFDRYEQLIAYWRATRRWQ